MHGRRRFLFAAFAIALATLIATRMASSVPATPAIRFPLAGRNVCGNPPPKVVPGEHPRIVVYGDSIAVGSWPPSRLRAYPSQLNAAARVGKRWKK